MGPCSVWWFHNWRESFECGFNVYSLIFHYFSVLKAYCDMHAVGQQWKRLQPLLSNATVEGTVVFFGVRSGNDVIQQ
jgi:hypothetical protein